MIENQLAPVPASKTRKDRSNQRQQQAVRKNLDAEKKSPAPVCAAHRNQRHARNGMSPAGDTGANAGHEKELCGADKACGNGTEESNPRGPKPDAKPEGIGSPPVEDIGAKRAEDQRNGEMNRHGMQGMPSDGDERTRILFFNLGNDGIFLVRGFQKSPPVRETTSTGRFRFRKFATCLFVAAALNGCSGDLSTLDPAGPASASIAHLWWIMLWGSVLLFALVIGLFFTSTMTRRFSGIPASRWIVWGGLVLPIPVLTGLLIAAFIQGETLFGARAETPAKVIHVEASMWNWDIRYGEDESDPKSRNVLHIPAGETVEIAVSSLDVIHSFWVPRLAGKIDAIPGHVTRIRLKADRPGTFGGICAEYCGVGHSAMTFTVVAHELADYERILQTLPDAQENT